jgi:hypothetical protein
MDTQTYLKIVTRNATAFLLLLLLNSAYAQEKSVTRQIDTTKTVSHRKSLEQPQKIEQNQTQTYPITISKKAGEEQVVHDAAYIRNEITRIDQHIAAIDQKVSIVSSDPVKKSEAESQGWFDQMARTRASLVEEKKKLETELESFKK